MKPKNKTMSPEAGDLIKNMRISGRKKLKAWKKILKDAAVYDQGIDEAYRRAGKLFSLFMRGIVGLLVVTALIWGITENTNYTLLSLILPAASLFLAVFYYFRENRLQKIDLANDFRMILIPFLDAVTEDIRPGDKIKLDLDIAGETAEKIVKQEDLKPGRYDRVLETSYLDPWLKLECPLADGGVLYLNIKNYSTARERFWTNPRGKPKYKCKWKKRATVVAGMMPNPDLLTPDSNLNQGKRFRIVEKGGRRMIRTSKKFKFKSTGVKPEKFVSRDDILKMFFKLYSLTGQV